MKAQRQPHQPSNKEPLFSLQLDRQQFDNLKRVLEKSDDSSLQALQSQMTHSPLQQTLMLQLGAAREALYWIGRRVEQQQLHYIINQGLNPQLSERLSGQQLAEAQLDAACQSLQQLMDKSDDLRVQGLARAGLNPDLSTGPALLQSARQ